MVKEGDDDDDDLRWLHFIIAHQSSTIILSDVGVGGARGIRDCFRLSAAPPRPHTWARRMWHDVVVSDPLMIKHAALSAFVTVRKVSLAACSGLR